VAIAGHGTPVAQTTLFKVSLSTLLTAQAPVHQEDILITTPPEPQHCIQENPMPLH
jgi:hypothetical protein